MTQTCGSCHFPISPLARYCAQCGLSLAQQPTQVTAPTRVESGVQANGVDGASFSPAVSAPNTLAQATSHTPPLAVGPREHQIFAIDVSGSMKEDFEPGVTKIDAAKRAAINLILSKRQVDPNDLVGIVAFNAAANIVYPLVQVGSGRRDLILALQSLHADGDTSLDAALRCCDQAFDWTQPGVIRRVVLLTDGHADDPLRTAASLKAHAVQLEVVGIGATPASVDEKLLKAVASVVGGEVQYRFIRDMASLLSHFTKLGEKTRVA